MKYGEAVKFINAERNSHNGQVSTKVNPLQSNLVLSSLGMAIACGGAKKLLERAS